METSGSRSVAIPGLLDVESFRSILGKIEIGEVGKRVSSAEIAAEGRRRVVGQQVCRDAGAAYVMVPVHGKEQLAAEERGAGFIGILIAVEHGEEEVAIVVFCALVVDVIAGIHNEIRVRPWRFVRQLNLGGIENEMG